MTGGRCALASLYHYLKPTPEFPGLTSAVAVIADDNIYVWEEEDVDKVAGEIYVRLAERRETVQAMSPPSLTKVRILVQLEKHPSASDMLQFASLPARICIFSVSTGKQFQPVTQENYSLPQETYHIICLCSY